MDFALCAKMRGKTKNRVTKTAKGNTGRPRKPETAWHRLCRLRGDAIALRLRRERGELVSRSDVVAAAKQDAEVIRSDLFSIGTRLASVLSGRAFSPVEVRTIIDAEIRSIVERWCKVGITTEEALEK
jgi:hypothetical protein